MDHQDIIDWLDGHIVETPVRVMLVFFLLTLVFAAGLGNISTQSGTQQFAQNLPAEKALETINQEFSQPFQPGTGSTQLVQRDQNVLAKPSMLRMLSAQKRLQDDKDLRVESTSSAASIVARTINPNATTIDQQIVTLERATPNQIDRAVREDADNPGFTGVVSNDFNRKSASASATIGVVTHSIPGGLSSGSGMSGSSPMTPIQIEAQHVVNRGGGNDITVFGNGIIAEEFGSVITDSLIIVTPAAVLFIIFFLIVAYRDLVDLLLGTFTLLMAVIWTFGFLGLANIPFSQMMIAVPPLLLAVGIDFGIHAVNRYREDREEVGRIDAAMRRATDQLLVAFFIVTGTTVIGFLSNAISALQPIRQFGIVAAVGITFTCLIFGVFLPAAKVWIDQLRERYPIPTQSQSPLGQEGSRLSSVLRGGVVAADKAPLIFIALILLSSVGAAYYSTKVDTSFTQEDFLPPAHTPAYLKVLPEPFKPGNYGAVAQLNYLQDHFSTTQGGSVTIYLQKPMTQDTALETIYRAGESPPDSFVRDGRHAKSQSIVTVIQSYEQRDPQFRKLVHENDLTGNGIPDRNLREIYDYLLSSPARQQTLEYLADDYRGTRVVYSVKADASNSQITHDGKQMAGKFRGNAVATGSTVVFQVISDLIFTSAIESLAIALGGTVVFLLFVYWILEGLPSLGVANTVPIAVTVAFVAGSMRALGISFNAFTAMILSLTIGLGIDYSVHVVHRFIDERREYPLMTALDRTVRGTGGALASSMLTTAFGIGVLVLSVLSVLGQFGELTALSIVYSFLSSIFVLPSVLVVWDRYRGYDPSEPIGPREGDAIAETTDESEPGVSA